MKTPYVLDARDILAWLASVPDDRVLGPYADTTCCYGTCAARAKWGGYVEWGLVTGLVYEMGEAKSACASQEAITLLHALHEAEIYDSETGWHVTRRLLLEQGVVTEEQLQEGTQK